MGAAHGCIQGSGPGLGYPAQLSSDLSPLPFQTRSSRHSQGSQPGLADQAKLSFASAESLETMSEAELPLGFNRMNRFRQSLPLSRSTSQTKLRSPGTLGALRPREGQHEPAWPPPNISAHFCGQPPACAGRGVGLYLPK